MGEAAAVWALGWTDPGLSALLVAALLLCRAFTMIIQMPFGFWTLSRPGRRAAACWRTWTVTVSRWRERSALVAEVLAS